jgi:hypothetical protein
VPHIAQGSHRAKGVRAGHASRRAPWTHAGPSRTCRAAPREEGRGWAVPGAGARRAGSPRPRTRGTPAELQAVGRGDRTRGRASRGPTASRPRRAPGLRTAPRPPSQAGQAPWPPAGEGGGQGGRAPRRGEHAAPRGGDQASLGEAARRASAPGPTASEGAARDARAAPHAMAELRPRRAAGHPTAREGNQGGEGRGRRGRRGLPRDGGRADGHGGGGSGRRERWVEEKETSWGRGR